MDNNKEAALFFNHVLNIKIFKKIFWILKRIFVLRVIDDERQKQ